MNNNTKLPDARLSAAVGYGRYGKTAADIGTDHAYLPIYLVSEGIAPAAVASDINKGPIESAKANIDRAGLSDKIKTVLTDGLCGIEKYLPDDIYILGMGGELIAEIIKNSEYVKNKDINLILQPMTRHGALREHLLGNGFCINDEKLVQCDGTRIYQIISASYDGKVRTGGELSLAVGYYNLERGGKLLCLYAEMLSEVYKKSAEGKKRGGVKADNDERLEKIYRRIASGEALSRDELLKERYAVKQ